MTRTTFRVDDLAEVRRLIATGEAKRICEAAHVRPAEVAREIGASQSAVSRWHTGERMPTGELAVRYLRTLRRLRALAGSS